MTLLSSAHLVLLLGLILGKLSSTTPTDLTMRDPDGGVTYHFDDLDPLPVGVVSTKIIGRYGDLVFNMPYQSFGIKDGQAIGLELISKPIAASFSTRSMLILGPPVVKIPGKGMGGATSFILDSVNIGCGVAAATSLVTNPVACTVEARFFINGIMVRYAKQEFDPKSLPVTLKGVPLQAFKFPQFPAVDSVQFAVVPSKDTKVTKVVTGVALDDFRVRIKK